MTGSFTVILKKIPSPIMEIPIILQDFPLHAVMSQKTVSIDGCLIRIIRADVYSEADRSGSATSAEKLWRLILLPLDTLMRTEIPSAIDAE